MPLSTIAMPEMSSKEIESGVVVTRLVVDPEIQSSIHCCSLFLVPLMPSELFPYLPSGYYVLANRSDSPNHEGCMIEGPPPWREVLHPSRRGGHPETGVETIELISGT